MAFRRKFRLAFIRYSRLLGGWVRLSQVFPKNTLSIFSAFSSRSPSLQFRLQFSSFLAVLVGFGLMFVASERVLNLEHLNHHFELVSSIESDLEAGTLNLSTLASEQVSAQLIRNQQTLEPQIIRAEDGSVWLQSRTPVIWAPNTTVLEVRENITVAYQSHQRLLLLLMVSAGLSVALTWLFLWLAIKQGLILPFRLFVQELEQLEADSLSVHQLSIASHPREMQPIVDAINQLQSRLAISWQREHHFMDGVSHELRTPIAVISARAQRMQAQLSGSSLSAINLIAAEAERMGNLVAVMHDLARVDAGSLPLVWVKVEPESLLIQAFERLHHLAPDRLKLSPPAQSVLPSIHADQNRIHQCLLSLVENALAYTSGLVHLKVSASAEDVIFHVSDQGSGISVLERSRVLQRFVRGTNSGGIQGSGIGLAIVNELMQVMQGELVIGESSGEGADLQLRFRISAHPPGL
ncbi:HAMP domain-containing histidine kinase [Synechococcus sp. AH-229-G18]|nr:HAMP domain-containing histidine kinase [Synechococcus sp. AH-229-G18]